VKPEPEVRGERKEERGKVKVKAGLSKGED
jgi:hypothetical protein